MENKWKNKTFREALKNALNGIAYAVKTQKNLKIQIAVACVIIALSIVLKINKYEAMAVAISIALVLFAEIMNTAIEKTVDFITEEYNEMAKIIKDVASGAVLILSLNSVVIGIIIFGDKILSQCAYFLS